MTLYGIKMYITLNEIKCVYVERVNKIVKKKIYRVLIYKKSFRWVELFFLVVESYNNSYYFGIEVVLVYVIKGGLEEERIWRV